MNETDAVMVLTKKLDRFEKVFMSVSDDIRTQTRKIDDLYSICQMQQERIQAHENCIKDMLDMMFEGEEE